MSSSVHLDRVRGYAASVLSGGIPSCSLVRLAVERWERDWRRDDLYFNPRPFELFCEVSLQFRHFKGQWAGEPIRLEDWQLFVAANVLGWYRRDTRTRRYTYADVMVPRKNGKTTFAAILCAFCLLFDGEGGAEVYTAAVDREQARICFDTARTLISGSIFAPMVRTLQNRVRVPSTAGVLSPLSKETKNKDGTSPSCAVCDERHAWATNEMYDVLKTGMGARRNPLLFSISTAGYDTSLPYYRDILFLEDVLRGKADKDNHFVLVYRPDDGDSWSDEETWRKVNPNLGVSLSLEYMRGEYEEAMQKGGTTLASFCVKNLDMWVDAPAVWIPDDDVKANYAPLDPAVLDGEECWAGIDLASKTDISAVALFFPSRMAVRFLYFVPEAKVASTEDRVDYRRWVEDGRLIVCPGNILDEDWFMARLLAELDRYRVRCIAYDPWAIWNILPKFGRYSDALMEYQQSIRYMSVPTKDLEARVLRHELNFLGDPVIRWMFGNVVIYSDPNGNIKLDKARSRNKIDGVVALVDAVGGWLHQTAGEPRYKDQYSDHDLVVVNI